jgi:hypothetical protein
VVTSNYRRGLLSHLAVAAVPLVLLLNANLSHAQSHHIQRLAEELDAKTELIEKNRKMIRTLEERIKQLEQDDAARKKSVKDLRSRLHQITLLKKEIQNIEARVSEKMAKKKGTAGKLALFTEVRIRPEYTANREDLNDDSDDVDAFWGHRVRLRTDYGFDTWMRVRVEIQEARTFGSNVNATSSLHLHQAWLELKPPMLPGLRIRAGRTEMSYGNERLIGRDDFSRNGRAFDGVVVRWGHLPYFDIEAFYTKIRETNTGGDQDFYGAYMETQAIPFTLLQAYVLGLYDTQEKASDAGGATAKENFKTHIWSLGGRADLRFLNDTIHLEGEAVVQLGKLTDPRNASRELDHFATAFYGEVSYQAPIATYPTVGAFFVQASGDGNPEDGKSVGFYPLFPTRHSFLGTMDLFAWRNIRDFGGKFELTPPWGLGFFAAFHYLQLYTDKGRLSGLGTSQTPNPNQPIGRNIGIEIDVALSWAPNEKLQMQAGYSIFLPGTVTKELKICGEKAESGCDAAQWAYIQTRLRF